MPYIASNNGLTIVWHDPAEDYQLKAGEVSFDHWPSDAELAAAFPGHAAALAAQQAAMKPPPTPRQWLERLAPATQAAISKAALADPSGQMLLWLLRAAGNPTIDVTAAETQQGVAALAGSGVISAQEAATLLQP